LGVVVVQRDIVSLREFDEPAYPAVIAVHGHRHNRQDPLGVLGEVCLGRHVIHRCIGSRVDRY
jgi:hypothetical protein